MKTLFNVDPWKLVETTLHTEDMRLSESLTSIGNGYMGMRGNFEEAYSGDSHRGTYIGGVWFPDKTRVGWWKNGYPKYFGKAINAVNIIPIHLTVDGNEVDLATLPVLDFYRELDMQKGILLRRFTVKTDKGTVTVNTERFLSVATKELLLINYTVTADYNAKIKLDSFIDGNVHNEDSNYDETFWDMIEEGNNGDVSYIITRTKKNPYDVPQFTVCTAMTEQINPITNRETSSASGRVTSSYTLDVPANTAVTLTKYVVITTSRDMEESKLAKSAVSIINKAVALGYDNNKQAQIDGWADRWSKSDVIIAGDDAAQQGIRFNLFQLFSTYYGEDARLNFGPKGFTGEKYGGATYWDTEAYCLPMYLSVADQKVAKNLLLYRYNQLEGAFENARQQGLDGALYPMVTFNGLECHNEWEITFEEIHRNAAIAHAVYNYVTYTGDKQYLIDYGIDVLAGIARFWASRVHYSKVRNQYVIHGVTGPNEYENNINNNFYTNFMAKFCLSYTAQAARECADSGMDVERLENLGLTEDKLQRYEDIASNIYLGKDEATGVFLAHDGFMDKDIRSVDTLSEADRPINQNWSWDRILRSCFIKQADTLQSFYMLPDRFDKATKELNFNFYEPMTVHESSLSPCVHSILAAEIGKSEKAVEMYQRTARLDLDNINNDTEDGCHITSMAGSWLSIAHGFAGMRSYDGLSFSPFLPDCWELYEFKINYKSRKLSIKVDKENVTIKLLDGEDITINLYGKQKLLSKDDVVVALQKS